MKLIAKKFLITLRNKNLDMCCMEGKTFLELNAELRETKVLKKPWYVTQIAYNLFSPRKLSDLEGGPGFVYTHNVNLFKQLLV